MGTKFDAAKSKLDPEDRLLWRRRPARLEGERCDAILSVSGTLNPQMFGPAFKPPVVIAGRDKDDKIPRAKEEGPAVWRRSVYLFTKRSLPIPLLEAFDAPTGNSPCTRRLTTTVATQSLALSTIRWCDPSRAFRQATHRRRRAGFRGAPFAVHTRSRCRASRRPRS